MFDCILIHYGELALKGLNRPYFEKKLIENIVKALVGQEYDGISKLQGRILIKLKERSNLNLIEDSLKEVFGVSWFAFCFTTEAEKKRIENCISQKLKFYSGEKVKVNTKRADKRLPFTSIDLNREIGEYIVKNFNVKISLKEPEREIFIELVDGKAYVFERKVKGLYGLPVGVSGRVLHLLSGGIDSPVAAWLLMKRGCDVDFLHFHAFQEFDEKRNAKILDLVKALTKYCFRTRVFFVPFYPFEAEAVEAPMKYRLLLFRRFMVRVAEKIARKHGMIAIGSGENIAQVSSQTLENIAVINDAASLPILRPLLTFEKNEIVNLAKKIGTFEISNKPYKDCCSLFIAKHPITKAKLNVVKAIEAKMHLNEAVNESVEKLEIIGVNRREFTLNY